jgi:sulfofructose kinase
LLIGDRAATAYDVLCVGRACVDEVLEVDAYPVEDAKVAVIARQREGGGQASTAACAVAHLGGRAGFLGVLGDDEGGRFARRRMAAFGVDLAFLPRHRGRTPTAWCLVSRSRATRTIVYEPSPPQRLTREEVVPAAAAARAVLVDRQGEHLLPDLVPFCRERAILTLADAERADPGWERTWGLVDVLAASQAFLEQAAPGGSWEDSLRVVAGRTRGWCCATLGAEGAIALLDGEILRVQAPRVEVRDTTGAGDAFHGALALALARGEARADALRYAVAAASLSCRGLGGRAFPSPAEVAAAAKASPQPPTSRPSSPS